MKVLVALPMAAAFVSVRAPRSPVAPMSAMSTEAMIEKSKADRLTHLESPARVQQSFNFVAVEFPGCFCSWFRVPLDAVVLMLVRKTENALSDSCVVVCRGDRVALVASVCVTVSAFYRARLPRAQAMEALTLAADNFERAVFPNAMIVGDCVITHLLGKLDYLKTGKVKIMVVDTYHLFDSTMPFLKSLEDKYGFTAEVFAAEGCVDKAAYDNKFGADLWQVDIEQYDKVCKVEPFQRGLKTLKTDVMINGRRRDHGVERACGGAAFGEMR